MREQTRWGSTQTKIHLGRLCEMEYVLVHRGRQGQGFLYELAYAGEGKDGGPFLAGLMDVEVSAQGTSTTSTSRGSEGDFAGGGRGAVGPRSGGGRDGGSSTEARGNGFHLDVEGADPKSARWGSSGANAAPYVNMVTPTAAVVR